MNPTDAIFHQAAMAPLRPALVSTDGMLTYGNLARAVNTAASNFILMGVQKGERVGVQIRHPFLHLIVILGLARIGAASLSLTSGDRAVYDRLDVRRYFVDDAAPVDRPGTSTFTNQIFTAAASASVYDNVVAGASFAPDDLHRIALTSGSTGQSKAVGLTALMVDLRLTRPSAGGDDGSMSQRLITTMGLSTAWGYVTILRALRNGALVGFAPGPAETLHLMSFYQITDLVTSVQQLSELVKTQQEQRHALPALKSVLIAGSKSPPSLIHQVQGLLCSNVVFSCGSTEAGRMAMASLDQYLAEPTCIGFPATWLDVQIVRDNGQVCDVNEEGQLRVSGETCVTQYMDAADSVGVFKDGYFYTGDLAYRRADGALCLTGRAVERINRGGVKFAPEAIEEALAQVGAGDACVAQIEVADGISLVIAGYTADADPGYIMQALGRQIQPEMMPDRVIKMQDMPRTESQKIDRVRARALLRSLIAN